ncbi:flagellar export chaperone FliS [Pseudomaricurvus alkylphenolicus]|uniref:flagellar export chaperone FliS n=1 Tax=Pseudomaricurvus alkylphenolicus TaxID=1306991 RepID=UPI00141F22C5|nr:flagellar export chaperone FliS [Pseudomaricurvus alkylphenolicus]NIB43224.1 flagellar export chaperone FliS [Pseudomaricurvus alkylphenolicus]
MKGPELYRQIDLKAKVYSASPHQLIALMYEGVLTSLAEARQAMESNQLSAKGQHITKAITILSGLRESLDLSIESDFPHNLDNLYDYMQRRLLQASTEMDVSMIEEVSELLLVVKSGWDQIKPQRPESR